MRQRYRLAATVPVLVRGPFLSCLNRGGTDTGGGIGLTLRQAGHGAGTLKNEGPHNAQNARCCGRPQNDVEGLHVGRELRSPRAYFERNWLGRLRL